MSAVLSRSRRPVRERKTSSRSAERTESAPTSIDAASRRSSSGAQGAHPAVVRDLEGQAPHRRATRRPTSGGPFEFGRGRRTPAGHCRRARGASTRRASPAPRLVLRRAARSATASSSASSRYWVVRKTVTPSATRSRTICHITRRLRGSRPVVGSSRKMIRGRPTRVIARSSRRRMPPEYSAAGFPAASTSSKRSSSSATRRRASSPGRWQGRPSGGGSPRR